MVLVNPVFNNSTCTSPLSLLNNDENNLNKTLQTNNNFLKKNLSNVDNKNFKTKSNLNQEKFDNNNYNNTKNNITKNSISNIQLMKEIKENIEKKQITKSKPPIPLHSNSKINDFEAASNSINFNNEKNLSVKKLAAKFNK